MVHALARMVMKETNKEGNGVCQLLAYFLILAREA